GSTFRELLVLRSTSGAIHVVAFSPDGQTLAMVVDQELAVRLWRLDRLRSRLAAHGLDWKEGGLQPGVGRIPGRGVPLRPSRPASAVSGARPASGLDGFRRFP